MWQGLFGAANLYAMILWAALILLPRWPALLAAVLYLGVGLLCLTYATLLVALLGFGIDPGGTTDATPDFTTIAGVRSIFASDGGATIGWIHYLAFDLFVGLWIARDADAKQFSRLVQAPILFATFMAGPLGLVLWLAIRERRARKQGRWQ